MITLYKSEWENNISPHFKVKEFYTKERPAPDSHPLDERLIEIGEYLRNRFGVPMSGFSTYRSEAYNASITGSSSSSWHITGHACDYNWLVNEEAVLVSLFYDISNRGEIYQDLIQLGAKEIIMYGGRGSNFIHIATQGPIEVIDKRSKAFKAKLPVLDDSGDYSTSEVIEPSSIVVNVTNAYTDAFTEFLMNMKASVGAGDDDDLIATSRFLSNPKVEVYLKILAVVLIIASPFIIKKTWKYSIK